MTAFIGPSGCGKTTLLRSLNRMNDLIPGAPSRRARSRYHGQDLYGSSVDAVEVRRRIGMVFQRPNPFPKSIYDNVAYGLRMHGMKDDLDAASSGRYAMPRCGTRSRTGSRPARCRCPAASSSGSASRARLRSSRT